MRDNLASLMEQARQGKNFDAVLSAVPYASLLGVQMEENAEGLLFTLPFQEKNIGNVALPAIHGGVIGGFMENAALLHLIWCLESDTLPKVIDFSLDYIRPGRPQTLFAACRVTKQGKRIANVQIESWQADRNKPVAVARSHFKVTTAQ